MEWKTVKLGDICEILDAKRIPLSAMEREKRSGIYPYYGAQGIIDHIDDYIFDENVLLIAEDGANLETRNEDIAIHASGKIWVNNHAHVVRSNGKLDLKLLCFILNHLDITPYITGSAQPKLNQANLTKISFEIPPLDEQKRIAAILSSIDAKIENNNRINANLEAQAQALYKSWFVDFEPWGGKMPEDWKEYHLGDFLPVKTGKKDANVASKTGIYPFFSCAQDVSYTDDYSFDASAILVAGNGDFNVKWYRGKFEAYQRTYVLIPYEARFLGWLFFAIKYNLDKITCGARGSVIKFITKGNLEDFAFMAPSNLNRCDVLDRFNTIIEGMEHATHESKRLANLRDTLLPKLMKGEVTPV